ncbi:MAG: VanZ family protein [Planctomycetales bacterium]|nr:VanZ family protein [Planctomycetales bacterium]MBN8626857.1 VanZ family protein [Planctomycetota bacterium]
MSSIDPHFQTNRRRANLLSALVGGYWALLVFVMHVPLEREAEQLAKVPKNSDKAVHFAAFGLFALLLCWAVQARRSLGADKTPSRPRIAMGVLLFTVAYGAIDEALQPLTGRDGNVPDFIADVIGAVLGVAAYLIIARLRSHLTASRSTS